MSFKLLTITHLYSEYLQTYYQQHPLIKNESYQDQCTHLLNDSSEPVGAYTREFNNLGIEASCIITNASFLQKTWKNENNITFNNKKNLVSEQIKKIKPDALWIDNVEFLDKAWLNQVKSDTPELKIIFGSHCSPFSNKNIGQFRNLDFILTCTPGLYNSFSAAGLKSFLIYHAFNPAVLDIIDNEVNSEKNNFIFTGSLLLGGGFHSSRTSFIEKILENNIDLKIYGNLEPQIKIMAKQGVFQSINALNKLKLSRLVNNLPILKNYAAFGDRPIISYSKKLKKATMPPVFGNEMFQLLKQSKITLNIHGEIAGDYAGNVRLFEATGVGTCLLTDNKKNMPYLFENNKEVVTYENVEDCIEKVNWLLNHEKERKEIALAGQKRTLTSHTVENRCNLIKKIIIGELKKL